MKDCKIGGKISGYCPGRIGRVWDWRYFEEKRNADYGRREKGSLTIKMGRK